MPKLPAPIESPVEFPGERHAPDYSREELAALEAVRKGDQFRWRGDHYLATADAGADMCNGYRRVFIRACAANPAMPSGWSLADISASRKIVPTTAEAAPVDSDFPGGGIAPELREAALVQRRNADGGLELFPASDLAGTAAELRARAADNRRAGNYGLAYVQGREAERAAAREALASVAAEIDGADLSAIADAGEAEREAAERLEAPLILDAEESTNYGRLDQFDSVIRDALRVDAARQDSGREPREGVERLASDAIAALCLFARTREHESRDGAPLVRDRFQVTGLDTAADGMERLRDQSEFILLAYPGPDSTAADIVGEWIADVDSCARPDGFDYMEARAAIAAQVDADAVTRELAAIPWADMADADDSDASPCFRLYVRDVRHAESGE